jgi:hypothetical protein
VIDRGEPGEHLRALGELQDRTPGALQPADRVVVVQPDDEDVAERARGGEVANVAGMEEIEAAVGEHDPRPGRAPRSERRAQVVDVDELRGRHDAAG